MFLKKIPLIFVILLLLPNMMCGCAKLFESASNDWQTMEIEGCGSIEIPKEWSYFVEDDVLYILDESLKPVMIQCHNYGLEKEESNKYYNNYKVLDGVYCVAYSNSARYEINKFLYEGKEVELPTIALSIPPDDFDEYSIPLDDFGDYYVPLGELKSSSVILVVWNTDIEEKLIKKIAKSFIME